MKNNTPHISIIGRRNVGKSTLFNAIARQKIAIVDSIPGLTRDIISMDVNYGGYNFVLSDTPGLDLPEGEELSQKIIENAQKHLESSDLIILLFENPEPLDYDFELLDITRKLNIPVIIAVNKMDHPESMINMNNFYETGASDFIPISAKYRKNIDLLFEKITDYIEPVNAVINRADIKISFVGRPNAGKSTLLNTYLGYERSIVSDIPGTTRDSVNEQFKFNDNLVEIIDTAGLRRKRKIKESVEFFSMTRTIRAIEESDVVIHLIDAEAGLSETDKKIADEIIKAHKPLIIAINKWDLIDKDHKTFENYKDRLLFKFYRAADFPIISISAKNKQRVHKILSTAIELKKKAETRIDTAKLNKFMERIQKSRRLPKLGNEMKVYYGTQVDTIPPQFIFFVNNKALFREDAIRFFQKELQKEMNLNGIPILIKLQGKENKRKK